MTIQVDENQSKQLHKILQDLAHFTALYEQTDDRFKAREEAIDKQLQSFKDDVQLQIKGIQKSTADLNEIMTEAGAARWRIAAEKSMKQGDEHLKAIRETCDVYKKLADDSVTHLEHTAQTAEKRIAAAMKHLSEDNFAVVDEFQRRTDETYAQLEAQSRGAMQGMKRILHWMRWDRVAISVGAAFLASLLISIYVNSEWPWESHAQSEQERVIGKTILTSWSGLSAHQQAEVNKILGTNIQRSAKTKS